MFDNDFPDFFLNLKSDPCEVTIKWMLNLKYIIIYNAYLDSDFQLTFIFVAWFII